MGKVPEKMPRGRSKPLGKPEAAAPADQPAGPQKRKRSDRETVRRKIMDSARTLFAERGYAGTTTREISERAEVNEVWIYRYFGSKALLFRQAVFDELSTFMNKYSEVRPAESTDLLARTRFYCAALMDRLEADKSLFMSLITTHYYEDAVTPGLKEMPEMREYFAGAVLAAKDTKAHFDPELTTRMTFGLILSMVLFEDWLLDTPVRHTRSELKDIVAHFVALGTIGVPPMPSN